MRAWTTIFLVTVGIAVTIAGNATWPFTLLLARGAFAVVVLAALLYGVRWLALQMADPHRLPAVRLGVHRNVELGVFDSTPTSNSS